MRAVLNETENKCTTQKIYKAKVGSLKKILE